MFRLIHITVFLGVLLQAMIPLGFMPGAQAGTAIVICSGYGEKTIHVDQDGQPLDEHRPDGKNAPCAFIHVPGNIPIIAPVSFDLPTRNATSHVFTLHGLRGHADAFLPEKTGPPAA